MHKPSREQQLVDICFAVGLLLSDTKGRDSEGNKLTLWKLPQGKKAEWIAQQLKLCGFETRPCGASHGVLLTPEQSRKWDADEIM